MTHPGPAPDTTVPAGGRRPQAPWILGRCVLLSPAVEAQRLAPSKCAEFGSALDHAIREDASFHALRGSRVVELVRRTGKGEYVVQLVRGALERLALDFAVSLPGFGRWTRSPSGVKPGSSVVVGGIPKTLSDAEVTADLQSANRAALAACSEADIAAIRVVRLNRRSPSSQGSAGPRWVPSTSVRVLAAPAVCEALLRAGGAVVRFGFHMCREYTPTPRRCSNCGEFGLHSGQFCRRPPRCRHCGQGHRSDGCPDRRSSASCRGSPGPRATSPQ